MFSSSLINPPIYVKRELLKASISVSQSTNISAGDHAKFDSVTGNFGSNISLDTTSAYSTTNGAASIGRITLKANRTVQLMGQIVSGAFGAGAANVQFQWYNATTGTVISTTTSGITQPPTDTGNNSNKPISFGFFTATVDTLIELRITAGTNFTNINADATIEEITSIIPIDNKILYAKIEDQKTAGTNGGGFTSGSFQTRTLNTLVNNANGFVTLSSNQFILPQGTYQIYANAPAFNVGANQIRLRNITDSITTKSGGGGDCNGTTFVSTLSCEFTITTNKTFEIQHRCGTTNGTDGFGRAGNATEVEVYTQVDLFKIR